MRLVLLLLCLLCTGCHGAIIDALERRQVASCVWWDGPLGLSKGVTATGGLSIETCLAVPCMTRR